MPVFRSESFDDHQQIIYCSDRDSGLRAIIALHSTVLGPALGGCRMWHYRNEDEALRDALRLSRGMTYKNAMAELPLGGGKSVILGDPHQDKTPSLLEAFGDAVESLNGRYITAEDVGTSVADMQIVARRTHHVSGLPRSGHAAGGDPSPKTALGVFQGILAAVGYRTGEPERRHLKGIRVAVQGLGSVGHHLCALLADAGAELLVADIDQALVEKICSRFGAEKVEVHEILGAHADVFSPCALGAILDERTIPQLNVSIVAGAANNQLATERDGAALHARNILYAPDYVINAGGVINVAHEHLGLGDEAAAVAAIDKIGPRLLKIFERSHQTGLPTNVIADEMARERLAGERCEQIEKLNAA